MYHFLVESKSHERIDLLTTASQENIYQTKKEKNIPTVMETCFPEGKLMKQFGNPLPLPPFQLTPYFLAIFIIYDLPLCPNFKNKNSPPPNFRGKETM